MVLIIALLCLFGSSDSLYDKYEKTVDKELKKQFSLKDFRLEPKPFEGGELFSVISDQDESMGYVLISEVAACNLGGCPAYKAAETNTASEYFDMLAVLDQDSQIISIKILDYFSDYGYEITSKKYLKKFKGHKVCQFYDDVDEIDAISGATISSLALEGKLSQLCPSLH